MKDLAGTEDEPVKLGRLFQLDEDVVRVLLGSATVTSQHITSE